MSYFKGLDVQSAFKALQPPEPKSPGLLGNVADTGLQLAQGVLQGGEMLANTFGADNAVSQTLRKGAEWLAGNFSDQLKWEQLTSAQDMKAAELSGSTWEEIKAASRAFGRDPVGYLVNAAGTSVPTIAAAFLPGGQGALLGRLAAMGMGGAQGAGAVKGQIYSEVENAWKQAGATEEEAQARAAAAQAYLGSNAGQIALGTALGVLAGGTGVEAGILGRKAAGEAGELAADTAATSIFGRLAQKTPRFIGQGVKEAIPEGLQGGQEAVAGNVALQNEGFDVGTFDGVAGNATLEALAGGVFGAATSPFTKPAQLPAPEAPLPTPDPDQALRDLGQAKTADDAIAAATRAAGLDVSLDAAGEDRALSIMERTAKADADAVKFGPGGRMPTPSLAGRPVLGPDGLPVEPTATVTDMPFADRVLTLREQLADPRVRDQLREFGDEVFDTVSYYASVADNTDVNLPEKTRERLLSLAEGIVSRAVLKPVNRPGLAGDEKSATLPLSGPGPGPARIGLDTTETGTIRVDSEGRAAPETRADQINTQRATLRERVDGMTAQVQGRPLPRDFTMVGEGELTTPARRERATDSKPANLPVSSEPAPTMLLTADGFPYGTRSAAVIRAKREGLTPDDVVQVEGGFAVQTQETQDVAVPDVDGAAARPVETADGRSDLAGGSVGDVRPVADAGQRTDDASAPAGSAGPAAAVGDGGRTDEALTPADTNDVPRSLGFEDNGPAEGDWTLPVSKLGDVVLKVLSAPGEPVRAQVSADYMGKRLDTRTAEGLPAIKEAIERAKDGIQKGRERIAAQFAADERGLPRPENPLARITGAQSAAPAAAPAGGFDSEAWDKKRSEVVQASRDAGNVHLDKVPAYVETMRGKSVFYVHDPKVRGVIRTVDNNGNVYIDWSDAYSAEKELASPVREGKRTVMRSSIGPRDLKDYALAGKPQAPSAAPSQAATPPAKQGPTTQGAPDGQVQAEGRGRQEVAPEGSQERAAPEPAAQPAEAAAPLAERVQRLRRSPTRTADEPAQTDAVPSRALIELRKREAVLKRLLDCMRE